MSIVIFNRTESNYKVKHRIVHVLQKYFLNPPIKIALAMSLPLPGYALLESKRLGNRILDWRGLAMPRSPGRRGQVGDALNRGISQAGQHVAEIIADLDLESAAAFKAHNAEAREVSVSVAPGVYGGYGYATDTNAAPPDTTRRDTHLWVYPASLAHS